MAKILILYYSRTGNTRKMAEAVAAGVKGSGAEAVVCDVVEFAMDGLPEYDGIIAGTPTYYGLAAGPVKDFFDRSVVHHGKLEGLVGGAFSSSAVFGGGSETAVLSILQMMLVHGMIIQGQARGNHYGVVTLGEPDEDAVDRCRQLGKRVGKLAVRLFG